MPQKHEGHSISSGIYNQSFRRNRRMSESSSTTTKPVANGIQGLAMMAPIIGVPLGLHAMSGALLVGVSIAPIALPAAVPLLVNFALKGDLSSFAEKLFATPRSTAAINQVIAVPVRVISKTSEQASMTGVGTDN